METKQFQVHIDVRAGQPDVRSHTRALGHASYMLETLAAEVERLRKPTPRPWQWYDPSYTEHEELSRHADEDTKSMGLFLSQFTLSEECL